MQIISLNYRTLVLLLRNGVICLHKPIYNLLMLLNPIGLTEHEAF